MTGQPVPEEVPAPVPRRQRPGWARRGLRLAARVVLGIAMLAGLGAGVLAWRLSQGPVEITWFDDTLARGVALGGGVIRAGSLSLAWDGWRNGGAAFPAIRLQAVTFAADGAAATVDAVLVHLSLPALLRGELAPTLLELHAPSLTLSGVGTGLGEDVAPDAAMLRPWLAAPDEARRHLALRGLRLLGGRVVLEAAPGRPAVSLERIALTARRGADGLSVRGSGVVLLAGAEIPLAIEGTARTDGSSSLRGQASGIRPQMLIPLVPTLLPLSGLETEVAVEATLALDATLAPLTLGLTVSAGQGRYAATGISLPFRGLTLSAELHTDGGVVPAASLTLDSGETLQATARAWRHAGEWQVETRLTLPSFDLDGLSRIWPDSMAPGLRADMVRTVQEGQMRGATAEVVLRNTAEGPRLVSLSARLPFQAVRLAPGILVQEALLQVAGDGMAWRVEELMLRLPSPRAGAAPSVITASGTARREETGWQAGVDLALDQIAFADLAALWPPDLAPSPRWWLTRNVTAGSIRNGAWRFDIGMPDGAKPRVRGLTGRARAVDATVQWLAPIPPVVGVSGDAVFTADSVTLLTEGGRQSRADGTLAAIELGAGNLRFIDLGGTVERAELNFALGGSLPDLLTLLRHPRLHLFDRRPLDLVLLDGRHATQVTIAFPLLSQISTEALRVRAEGRLTQLRVARALLGRDLENGTAELFVDQERLRLQGTATMLGAPLRLLTEMDFRQGPATQIVARESIQGTATVAQLVQIGFDLGDVLDGSIAIDGRTERRRNGQATVTLRADLAPASIALPAARWGKRVGSPGRAEATLRLQGDSLVAVENARVDVLDLSLRGRAIINRGRIERYELAESLFGASRFQGDVRPPTQAGAPWLVNLRGPLLDLRPILTERRPEEPSSTGQSPPLVLEARFDRVTMGERRELFGVQGRAVVDERSVMRQGSLRGRTAAGGGGFELTVAPRASGRSLRITAEDGGAVLRALDNITAIEGGRLTLTGGWDGNEPGAMLTATAELDGFVVRGAPAIGKLLQAMTLYGMVDALQGGQGLTFARAEVPFTLTREALTLIDARAFSASLGLTARGRILREADILDIEGTIVPAYIFNTLLGNLPVLGRLFSPEPGGGVFATTYRVQGQADDPRVQINPLSTLTPGFLRGLFGLGQGGDQPAAPRR